MPESGTSVGREDAQLQPVFKRRWLLLVLLLPLFSYLLLTAVQSGRAYIDQYRLNAMLDRWIEQSSPVPVDAWTEAESLALTAAKRHGDDVDILNAAGRLYAYRSTRMAVTKEDRHLYARKAVQSYKAVTRLRPAWPYGWLNLALIKAHEGEMGAIFKHALMQLVKRGPWERNTLPVIVNLSLLAWPYLNQDERIPLLNYLTEAQEKRSGDVRRAVTGSHQLKLYCVIMTHAGAGASFCP